MRGRPARRWAAGAAAAALLGVVAACGSGAPTSSPSAATATAAAAAGYPTTPTVAYATTTVISGTATTIAPGVSRPPVLLGDMNTPEQFILGELYQDALTHEGYTVQLDRNIGTTAISQAAMAEGDLEIYPEYLNVYDSQVARLSTRFATVGAAYRAGAAWARAHGQRLLAPTRFADTVGVAVLTRYARAHHLRTLAGLRRVQNSLILGSPLEFSANPAGLPALERAYGFAPAITTPIDIGTQYLGLRVGALGAAWVQTSDWQLADPRYRLLADPRHVLGFGNIVPVVSAKTIAAEGPAFLLAIRQVDALLTTQAMRGLVAEVEGSPDPSQSAVGVAQEFLQGNGLTNPPPWSIPTTPTGTSPTPAAPLTDATTSGASTHGSRHPRRRQRG
ncbi:MAG TPA: glycine betaine ABC transporter substrate-binding protein [Solirubrobacteraceae bacterium]|nr:glycine betaine ABC transporter substrate-binding protein [Solirubrobacteraceae bacterium]